MHNKQEISTSIYIKIKAGSFMLSAFIIVTTAFLFAEMIVASD